MQSVARSRSGVPGLFSLPVWGAIVGMFELNNLELVVESPIGKIIFLPSTA